MSRVILGQVEAAQVGALPVGGRGVDQGAHGVSHGRTNAKSLGIRGLNCRVVEGEITDLDRLVGGRLLIEGSLLTSQRCGLAEGGKRCGLVVIQAAQDERTEGRVGNRSTISTAQHDRPNGRIR